MAIRSINPATEEVLAAFEEFTPENDFHLEKKGSCHMLKPYMHNNSSPAFEEQFPEIRGLFSKSRGTFSSKFVLWSATLLRREEICFPLLLRNADITY